MIQEPTRLYVLIHDESEGGLFDPTDMLLAMKEHFISQPCFLLVINSLPPTAPNLQQADIWTERSVTRRIAFFDCRL